MEWCIRLREAELEIPRWECHPLTRLVPPLGPHAWACGVEPQLLLALQWGGEHRATVLWWAASTVAMPRIPAGQPVPRAGWCTATWSPDMSCPGHAAQPHDHPDSEQQDIGEKEWFTFWIKSLQKISMVHVAAESHDEAILRSVIHAATKSHAEICDPSCHQLQWARKLLLQ